MRLEKLGMSDMNLIELNLDEIEASAGTQVRRVLDKGVIREYAGWMQNGAPFPPIVVFSPQGSERYLLADGFHRMAAARLAGLSSIAVDLRVGDVREALEHALGCNEDHGLRRTAKDRRNAIEIACKDSVWGEQSNRQIAALVKVDHKTVGKIRDELHLTPDEVKTARKTKDGEPVKQKSKPKKSEPELGNSPVTSIDKQNRSDLLRAIEVIKGMPFNREEAIERLHLQDSVADFDYCHEWFGGGD